MADNHDARAANLQAYRGIKDSLAAHYGHGRYVAIYCGQVSADAETFGKLLSRLAELGQDPSKALVVQAGVDYPEEVVIYS